MSDLCRCGHTDDEHVLRSGARRCTVCTCDTFDWDIDAYRIMTGGGMMVAAAPALDAHLACEAFGASDVGWLRTRVREFARGRYPETARADAAAIVVHDLAAMPARPTKLDELPVSTRAATARDAALCYLGYDPSRPLGEGFEPPTPATQTADDPVAFVRRAVEWVVDVVCYHGEPVEVVAAMVSEILLSTRNRAHRDQVTIGKRTVKRFESDIARARRLADLVARGFRASVEAQKPE